MHQCLLVIAVPAFLLYLFTPFPDTKVLCTYILLLLLFRLFIFAIVLFLPLNLFTQSCFFKFLQLAHGRRLRRWCCPFLPSHTLGTSLREWHGSGLARRKPSEYLPESIRADSPAWLTSLVATPKRRSLNDGCRLWGLGGTNWKAFRHPTFHVFLFAHGQRERHRELSADGQSHKSTSEVPDRWQAFARPSRCTLASRACCPRFSLFIVRGIPFQYAFLIFTLWHSKLSFYQALPGRKTSHLIAIRPGNLRRYFSTPVRYVPVAKVKPQIGMESSYHKGFRENLHTARGSILPKKLTVSNLQPLIKPQERNKRR